jgi:integrase
MNMASVTFTARFIDSLKPEKKQSEHWDTSFRVRGAQFGVRCYSTGDNRFILRYRRADGSRPQVDIGSAKILSLAEARAKALAMLKEIHSDKDPAKVRDDYRRAETISELYDLFNRRHIETNLRPSTRKEYRRLLEKEVLPRWGKRKAKDIKRRDVIELLEYLRIERKVPKLGAHLRAILSKMFRFALQREIIEHSPCMGLPDLAKDEKPRAKKRVLTNDEIRSFWQIALQLDEPRRTCFMALMLLGQRAGETGLMRWREIKDNVWIIPGERAKNGEEHHIPLPPFFLSQLEKLRLSNQQRLNRLKVSKNRISPYARYAEAYSDFVFVTRYGSPMETEDIGKACLRLVKQHNFEKFSPHDLRRTLASRIRELGIGAEVVKFILNHKRSDVTGVHYDHFKGEDEKKNALKVWEEFILKIADSGVEGEAKAA